MIALRGITWDHARGFDPLAAASALYAEQNPGVSAAWERRSLQAFGDMPLSMLADRFDLMVIDHPHIGEATSQGLLVPLDGATHAAAIEDLARNSIGPSHASYRMGGRQWALAIDAAAQVAAHRPDRLSTIPRSWDEVASLAREARVIWPLKPVDAIDSFFTLAANIGKPVGRRRDRLIERDSGLMILNLMREIAVMVPSECLRWSPIEALEALASDEGRFAYCPLLSVTRITLGVVSATT